MLISIKIRSLGHSVTESLIPLGHLVHLIKKDLYRQALTAEEPSRSPPPHSRGYAP